MESYDEDLTENGWYICLCQKHDDLFQKASNERWMVRKTVRIRKFRL